MHPFCNLQSRARTHAVLVIGLYELLDPTTELIIEPPPPPPLNAAFLAEKQQIPILLSLVWTDRGSNSRSTAPLRHRCGYYSQQNIVEQAYADNEATLFDQMSLNLNSRYILISIIIHCTCYGLCQKKQQFVLSICDGNMQIRLIWIQNKSFENLLIWNLSRILNQRKGKMTVVTIY